MPTPLIIALGFIAWFVLACGLAWLVGGAIRLGDEAQAEIEREFAKGGEDWC